MFKSRDIKLCPDTDRDRSGPARIYLEPAETQTPPDLEHLQRSDSRPGPDCAPGGPGGPQVCSRTHMKGGGLVGSGFSCGPAATSAGRDTTAGPVPARPGLARPGRLQFHPLRSSAPPGAPAASRSGNSGGARCPGGQQPLLRHSAAVGLGSVRFRVRRCRWFSSSFFTAEGPRLQEGRKEGRKRAGLDGKCSS